MGRSKAFDVEEALTSTMHTFREFGYANTSITQLEQSSGLKAGSLYHAFGNKEALFLASLHHYNQAVVHRRIADYIHDSQGVEGICALFRSVLVDPYGPIGCLLTNTAIECGDTDPAISTLVDAGLQDLETAFCTQLQIAQNAGIIPSQLSPKTLSMQLLIYYQGLLVLVRAGRDLDSILRSIDAHIYNITGASHV